MPGLWRVVWALLESGCLLFGVMGLYRWLPNTQVRWRDAFVGGLFVVIAFMAAKALLGWYVSAMTTFSAVYGAFATLPILLLWIYIVWLLILTGALVAAQAPGMGVVQVLDLNAPGGRFTLALALLHRLAEVRDGPRPSRDIPLLARELRTDLMALRTVIDRMREWGWIGVSDGMGPTEAGVYLRLHPRQCPLALPVQAWLLPLHPESRRTLQMSRLDTLTLADVLPPEGPLEIPVDPPA
jgi:membrane protein